MMVVRKKRNISGLMSRNNKSFLSPIYENREVDAMGERDIENS